MTVKEVAVRCGVSVALVYAWIERKQLPHYRLGRGRRGKIVVEEADLVVFLATRKVEALPPPIPAPQPPRPLPKPTFQHLKVKSPS
jgi:excisionase family DNA binding protein